MKFLDALLASVVLCISSLPLILLLLTLQQDSAVPANPPLDQAQVREIQQLLIDNDPRQLLASPYQEVRLSENELNALITYVKNSNPQVDSLNIHADLVENGANVKLGIPVAAAGFLRYLNLTLYFSHEEDRLVLTSMDAGALGIPRTLMSPLREAVTMQLGHDDNYQLVAAFIDSLHFQSVSDERMVILLDWHEDDLQQLENQARQVFVSSRESERLLFYQDKLAETIASLPPGVNRIRLNDLLRPLFLFASLNSASGADPIAENRAVFITLCAYLTDLELSQLIGTDVDYPLPREVEVIIETREDLARHVVSSAAIAASAGAAMAEVLSVYKEVHDSRYRTGFSFTDIAANQAGQQLGTLASRSRADALLFQEQMKTSLSESDYIPPLGRIDGMTEAEFTARYGSRDSEAYRQRLQEINDSINSRPFYQAF